MDTIQLNANSGTECVKDAATLKTNETSIQGKDGFVVRDGKDDDIYIVYRIDAFSVGDNSYVTDRTEDWIVRRDRSFTSLLAAKDYIRNKSRIHTDLVLFLPDGCAEREEQRNAIVDAFCFDDPKYLKYRRFFIGEPPLQAIKEALRHDGVHIAAEQKQ